MKAACFILPHQLDTSSFVPYLLDLFVVLKIFVMRGGVAAQAVIRPRFSGQRRGFWIFAMTATGAVAGLATDTASVFRQGEGFCRLGYGNAGDMAGEAVLVELLFALLQGRVGLGVFGLLP